MIFTDTEHTKPELSVLLEKAVYEDFGLNIKVLIRDMNDFDRMMEILPESWKNNEHKSLSGEYVKKVVIDVKYPDMPRESWTNGAALKHKFIEHLV